MSHKLLTGTLQFGASQCRGIRHDMAVGVEFDSKTLLCNLILYPQAGPI